MDTWSLDILTNSNRNPHSKRNSLMAFAKSGDKIGKIEQNRGTQYLFLFLLRPTLFKIISIVFPDPAISDFLFIVLVFRIATFVNFPIAFLLFLHIQDYYLCQYNSGPSFSPRPR